MKHCWLLGFANEYLISISKLLDSDDVFESQRLQELGEAVWWQVNYHYWKDLRPAITDSF